MLVPSGIHAKYPIPRNAKSLRNPRFSRTFTSKITHSIPRRPLRAPRKIGATHAAPQNCRQMIPLRSRSDSLTFTPELHAIGIESNFSRCP